MSRGPDLNQDIILACVHLVGRAGAKTFNLGHLHDNVPISEAGWYAEAMWKGHRVIAENHSSPSAAALALAEQLLTGATCRCGQLVALSDGRDGCRWRLVGDRWQPGCDAPPIRYEGEPGDVAAIAEAGVRVRTDPDKLPPPLNRTQRRRLLRRNRKDPDA